MLESGPVHDLAVIVTSLREARWLEPCLRTLADACDGVDVDVVVVDIEPDDGVRDDTRELVATRFPDVRVVGCTNRGFAHANNTGLLATSSRYVLFLNPDTEVVAGRFAELLGWMEEHDDVGIAGCRQLTTDGALYPTMRREGGPGRVFAEALGAERFAPWAGQRVLDLPQYEHVVPCDWTTGSFMLARREALLSAGCLDERFFLYCEEEDLCLRVRDAGWRVVHVPFMTIVHHFGKAGVVPRLAAQRGFARRQYAAKHLGPVRRRLYVGAFAFGLLLRALALVPARGSEARRRRAALMGSLRAVTGRAAPPFVAVPPTALPPRAAEAGWRERPVLEEVA